MGTPTSQTTATLSLWVKRSSISKTNYGDSFWDAEASNYNLFGFAGTGSGNTDSLLFNFRNGGTYYSNAVYRDPSAWYHIVCVYDSTNATQADRFRFFVNGVRGTFISSPAFALNYTFEDSIGAGNYRIGDFSFNSSWRPDFYLAEYYWIDGQALTPSSFGETDAITGRWKAKAYSGTYGKNGFYLPFTNNTSTSGNSVLFSEDFSAAMYTKNDSSVTTNTTTAPNGATTADTLTENTATATHRFFFNNLTYINGTTYTTSIYVKANTRTAVALENWNGTVANYCYADLSNGTVISGSHASAAITSVGSGWYRISVSNVGTGAASCGSALYLKNNNTSGGLSYTGNGSSSIFIWGMQTEAFSTLGPYLSTNGTAIGSTLLVGADSSVTTGGYNSWIVNNFSVATTTLADKVANDSLVDSPTNYGTDTGVGGEVRGNYATLSGVDKSSNAVQTNGNLDTNTIALTSSRSSIGISSGKWYCEVVCTYAAYPIIGVTSQSQSLSQAIGNGSEQYGYYVDGKKYNNGTPTNYGNSWTTNDVIGVALDMDSKKVWFAKNGTWQASGNPSTGVNEAFSGLPNKEMFFGAGHYSAAGSSTFAFNFGQRPFSYAAPTGFKALCTTNLPIPRIKKPNTAMDVVTYAGDSTSSRTISGLNFNPDLIWIKNRTNAYNNTLVDVIRGGSLYLESNNTNADQSATVVSSFNSDGFQIGTSSIQVNGLSNQYVAWAWDAGSSSVSNTSGSITSTVRANPQAGFSIVGYTGNGTAGATVGHGLGTSPSMIIAKKRSTATSSQWTVGFSALGWNKYILLNTTGAVATDSNVWNSAPTSSVFYLGTDIWNNQNGQTTIAYCFAEIEGFSKIGSYTGNGVVDGPFVYCGFKPRFIMIKRTDSLEPWIIKDTARSIYNGYDVEIYPTYPNIEGGPYYPPIMDYLSNGFKLRSNTSASNGSGNYIFVAFAESPFKYSMAR
jgi:hypothetical protein